MDERKYGLLNLGVVNRGKRTAKDCRITCTITELEFKNQRLFWLDPKYKETKKPKFWISMVTEAVKSLIFFSFMKIMNTLTSTPWRNTKAKWRPIISTLSYSM